MKKKYLKLKKILTQQICKSDWPLGLLSVNNYKIKLKKLNLIAKIKKKNNLKENI